MSENLIVEKKKRGRKPKNQQLINSCSISSSESKTKISNENAINKDNDLNKIMEDNPISYKKRGRKPKGGKIISTEINIPNVSISKKNIILHLKCKEKEINNLNKKVENYKFAENKIMELNYSIFNDSNNNNNFDNNNECNNNDSNNKNYNNKIRNEYLIENKDEVLDQINNKENFNQKLNLNNNVSTEISMNNEITNTITNKNLNNKLHELSYKLQLNSVYSKKSCCFYCTYEFDNHPIHIPKYEINGSFVVYGCFCSPECACAYLFNEKSIDSSTIFERYQLLNYLYCKIYNYDKNIKPAPNPLYLLDKFQGNLSIQEYRKLLKNERLLLVIDKPLVCILPELHEDSDQYLFKNNYTNHSNYKKQSLLNNFNI